MKFLCTIIAYIFLGALPWGCEFDTRGIDPCSIAAQIPDIIVSPYESGIKTITNIPNELAVYQGSACGKLDKTNESDVQIRGLLALPQWATNATVFLNGWKLEFAEDDHHVRTIGAMINGIRLEDIQNGKRIKWNVVGLLGDYNYDDAFSFCYNYTVIAWNESSLKLAVDHTGNCTQGTSVYNTYPIRGYSRLRNLPRKTPATMLPRGFFFRLSDKDDHHLLQLAYNIVGSERILGNTHYNTNPSNPNQLAENTSRYDSAGMISWNTQVIYKDKAEFWSPTPGKDGYIFGEQVTSIGGEKMGVIHPPYLVTPVDDNGFLTGTIPTGSSQVVTKEYIINNIPFESAIPVLTGWNLNYEGEDHHVRKMGVWISDWSYTKLPRATRGILKYTLKSILADDSESYSVVSHRVTVLGLKPVALVQQEGGEDLPGLPDLR